ncbi:MOXD1 homolog 2 [Eumeta japonica]|uniref:MOXD1 homolog 2 n=1 Tax=Eumeta variegata TaxID=151549 RepID=A0A4C1VMP2_EUMVA|nr:MOXD1 homolog 2 [Eumeta japonica]
MRIRILIALSALSLCNAKLPRTKSSVLSDELSKYNTRLLQELQPEAKSAKTSRIVQQYGRRVRSVFDSKSYESSLLWTHSENLDGKGDIVLRWVNSDGSITFRVEARTKGYLGVGFNSKKDMRGADLVAAWVDDASGIAQILVVEQHREPGPGPRSSTVPKAELKAGIRFGLTTRPYRR